MYVRRTDSDDARPVTALNHKRWREGRKEAMASVLSESSTPRNHGRRSVLH